MNVHTETLDVLKDGMLQRINLLKRESQVSIHHIFQIAQKAESYMRMLYESPSLFKRGYLHHIAKLDEYIFVIKQFNSCCELQCTENDSGHHPTEDHSRLTQPSSLPDPYGWLNYSNAAECQSTMQTPSLDGQAASNRAAESLNLSECQNMMAYSDSGAGNLNLREHQRLMNMPSRSPPDPYGRRIYTNSRAVENINQPEWPSTMPDPFDCIAYCTTAAENLNLTECQRNTRNTFQREENVQQANDLPIASQNQDEHEDEGERTDQQLERAKKMQKLALPDRGDRVKVLVTHAYGSHVLYGQLLQDNSSSDMGDRPSNSKQARNLPELVMLMNPPTPRKMRPHILRPVVGQLVGAVYDVDHKLYRARVMQYDLSKGVAEVQYVDYGNRQWVPELELFVLEEEWCWLAEQAVRFVLSDVIPVPDPLIIAKARKVLEDVAVDKTFNALIVDKVEGEDELILKLFKEDGANLSDILIKSGIVKRKFK